MARRKKNTRSIKPGVYIIGEGITEQYYLSHVKRIFRLNYIVKPRFFGNSSILELEKKIEALLPDDVLIICVFDADVSKYNEAEKQRLELLYKIYGNSPNVLLCDSLPSIEFWFLIHFLDTNRRFQNSSETETLLKIYIASYRKTRTFLEKEKWVTDLCSDGKLEHAIHRAKQYSDRSGSYSNLYKAFEMLFENK
ncbi:MAG: RloB family protein [Porphyromonadaceae bacterium]|nr:RloB family protein [Porphyromonadaceae bacterium]